MNILFAHNFNHLQWLQTMVNDHFKESRKNAASVILINYPSYMEKYNSHLKI